jgi:hypothetical protein
MAYRVASSLLIETKVLGDDVSQGGGDLIGADDRGGTGITSVRGDVNRACIPQV